MLMYEGRQLPLLRSKLLLLRQKEQHWFIDSLDFNFSDNIKIRKEKKPQVEWKITSPQLPMNSQIILSSNDSGEIFLLEKTISVLFRLTQYALVNKNSVVDSGENNTNKKKSSENSVFILLLIFALVGAIYYWFKRNGHSVKSIVRQQFSSFELSDSRQQIGLYYRHQHNAKTIIDIVDIVRSEIKLNEHSVCVVNAQIGHGFNHDKEQDLRTIFVNEKIDKMVDGKMRQISLLLTDKQKHSYTVCLYMRKGSNRISKQSYVKVINELIDWCWFIGEKVNPDNTDKRKVESIVLPKEKTESKSTKNHKTSLHNQAADIRRVTHQMDNVSPLLATDVSPLKLNVVNKNIHSADLAGEESSGVHTQVHQSSTIDTELVNALDKLVNLKQKGFLTMEEFSKAKNKLLKSLLEK